MTSKQPEYRSMRYRSFEVQLYKVNGTVSTYRSKGSLVVTHTVDLDMKLLVSITIIIKQISKNNLYFTVQDRRAYL